MNESYDMNTFAYDDQIELIKTFSVDYVLMFYSRYEFIVFDGALAYLDNMSLLHRLSAR